LNIIYLGAEVPSNRTILEESGASHVGVSFWRLTKRGMPKTKAYLLSNYFSPNMNIFVHPGIPRGENLDRLQLEAFAAEYEEFVANNIDRINMFTEVTHPQLSQAFIEEQRRTCWSEVTPSKFLPVWATETGKQGLEELALKYLDIGISGESIEEFTWLASETRRLRQYGTRFHALACAKPDNLRQVCVESASTLSWISPMTRGETIVWDGTRLVRYPKKMKDQARTRYRKVYEKSGVDFDKIMEDDDREVCKLAVWSYQQLEIKLSMINNNGSDGYELYDNSDDLDESLFEESTPSDADKKGIDVRKLEPRNPSEMVALPVFGYEFKEVIENENGKDVIKEVPVIKSNSSTLRACDTCFVASNCPAFKPQTMCAFNLPVEVKTKEQLKSLINTIIEMQGQRVAFMRFAEEMSGGYADPNVSQEIDRLFKLIKTVKELDDSREFIRMTVERQGGAGVLSSIFGDKAQALKELPNNGLDEDQTTRIIQQSIEE